jgi:hypothetical protein
MYKYIHIDEMLTMTGVAWSALITDGENKVCEVYNQGNGGCNNYRFATKLAQVRFTNWANSNYPDEFEPLDYAVEQLWEESL